MRRLLLGLALLLPSQGWAAELAADNFDRADGGLGANWTTVTGFSAPAIRTNVVEDNAVGGAASIALRTAEAFPDDQYAQLTVKAAVTSNGRVVAATLRGVTTARTHYECQVAGPLGATATLTTVRYNAGAGTTLAGGTAIYTVAANDVLYCEIIGSTITLKINGTTILGPTVDGTPITSGDPGILLFVSAGTTADAQLDDFSAGSASATAAGSTGCAIMLLLEVGAC